MTDEQRRALLRDPRIGDALRERLERELGDGPQPDGQRGETSKVATARTAGPRTLTERRMAATLTADPDVVRWEYEAVKVRVGVERAWFTADFLVVHVDGSLELREVKGRGRWRDARATSRAKFQAAAKLYPEIRWTWYEWTEQGWHCEADYEPREAR